MLAVLWCCCVPSVPDSWSDGSRLATVESLLHRGTFAIDGSPWSAVGDRVRDAEGFRSHHPPLLALLALPLSAALELLGFELSPAHVALHYLLLVGVLVAAPLAAFAAALARHLSERRSTGARWIPIALLAASFATPYSVVLNHHLPAAALAGFGVLSLLRQRSPFECGLWFGCAAALDPGALAFSASGAIASMQGRDALRRTAQLVAGMLPGFALAAGVQILSTGGLAPSGLDSAAFAWPKSAFLFEPLTGHLPARSAGDTWLYLARGTIGSYGLFAYHPWLVLGVLGALWSASRTGESLAAKVALGGMLGILAAYGLLSDNHGGSCFGVRWFVLFVPAIAPFVDRAPLPYRAPWFRAALALVLLWSGFFAAVGALAPFSRWNPFVRHGDELLADRAEGRNAASGMVLEALRVRSLGPRFDEAYLSREFELGLEARLRKLELGGQLETCLSIEARLAEGAREDLSARSRAALATARILRRLGDAGAAWRAAQRGLALRPGEPRLVLLAAEVAAIDLDCSAWAEPALAALRRLLDDRAPEPEPGWRSAAAQLLERDIRSRSGRSPLPSNGGS